MHFPPVFKRRILIVMSICFVQAHFSYSIITKLIPHKVTLKNITNNTTNPLLFIIFTPEERLGLFNNVHNPSLTAVQQYIREHRNESESIVPDHKTKINFTETFHSSGSRESKYNFVLYNPITRQAYQLLLRRELTDTPQKSISLFAAINRIQAPNNVSEIVSYQSNPEGYAIQQPFAHYVVNFIIEDPIENSDIEINGYVEPSKE